MSNDSDKNEYLKLSVLGIVSMLIIVCIIFSVAGRLDYWQGWVFSVVNIVGYLFIVFFYTDKVNIVMKRVEADSETGLKNEKFWGLYTLAYFIVMVYACLDAGRYLWSNDLSVYTYAVSYIVFIFSNHIFLWAIWSNKYFFSSIKVINKEEVQNMDQKGPYKIIRFPEYLGAILLIISTCLTLGSLWALIPTTIIVVLLIAHTYSEDITLKRELPGYIDYAQKVKYRLVPGIW